MKSRFLDVLSLVSFQVELAVQIEGPACEKEIKSTLMGIDGTQSQFHYGIRQRASCAKATVNYNFTLSCFLVDVFGK